MKNILCKQLILAAALIIVVQSGAKAQQMESMPIGGQTMAGPGKYKVSPGETTPILQMHRFGVTSACITAQSETGTIFLGVVNSPAPRADETITINDGQMATICLFIGPPGVQIKCLSEETTCRGSWRIDHYTTLHTTLQ